MYRRILRAKLTGWGLTVLVMLSLSLGEALANEPARLVVTTDLFVAEIAAAGGDLIRLELRGHAATAGSEGNFALFERDHLYSAQSGLVEPGLPTHKTMWQLPTTAASLRDGEGELSVRIVAPQAEGVRVAKTYVFKRGSYLIDVQYDVTNTTRQTFTPHIYYQLTRDGRPPSSGSPYMTAYVGPAFYTSSAGYAKIGFDEIRKNKAQVPAAADNGWVAMVQHYFVAAWLPATGDREFFVRELSKDLFAAGVIVAMPAVGPGKTVSLITPLYAGPQDQNKLARIAPNFNQVADYGWLSIVAAPLFLALQWLNGFVGNWGWSIILLTVLIKAAFFPLSLASNRSIAKMRLLAPAVEEIKATYAGNKQRIHDDMMALYAKEGVNPLGGCLPLLIQIPVFLALYAVLSNTVELRGMPWFGWIADLSSPDPYYILPVVMGVTMVLQARQNPKPPSKLQESALMLLPVLFTAMFLFFPAGLVLYWTVNNLLSIGQQWQVNRVVEACTIGRAHTAPT